MREHATDAAAFLKALANDQRLLVLCALLDGELSVGEINERVPLSQSALSQHLSVLREAGLVTTARQSQTIYLLARARPGASGHGGLVFDILQSRRGGQEGEVPADEEVMN